MLESDERSACALLRSSHTRKFRLDGSHFRVLLVLLHGHLHFLRSSCSGHYQYGAHDKHCLNSRLDSHHRFLLSVSSVVSVSSVLNLFFFLIIHVWFCGLFSHMLPFCPLI